MNAVAIGGMIAIVTFSGRHSNREPDPPSQGDRVQHSRQHRRAKKQNATKPGVEPHPKGPLEGLGFVDTHMHLNDVEMAQQIMRDRGGRACHCVLGTKQHQ